MIAFHLPAILTCKHLEVHASHFKPQFNSISIQRLSSFLWIAFQIYIFRSHSKKTPRHWPCMSRTAEVHGYCSEQVYVTFVQPSLYLQFTSIQYQHTAHKTALRSKRTNASKIHTQTKNNHQSTAQLKMKHNHHIQMGGFVLLRHDSECMNKLIHLNQQCCY